MRRGDFPSLLPLAAAGAGAGPAAGAALPLQRTLDVVVVGGGIAGLCAAYELEGLDVALFEGQARVGGRAIDRVHRGWSYALGTVYLGRPYGVLARVTQRLGLRPIQIARPTDAVFDGKRLFVGEAQLVRQMVQEAGVAPFNRLVKALRRLSRDYDDLPDYRPGRRLGALDRVTARQWLRDLDLPPVIVDRLEVMARGLFGAGLDDVSALGTLSEFAYELAESDLLDSPDDIEDMARELAREGSGAFTLEGGISRIAQALAEHLGNRVHTGVPVLGVARNDTGFTVRLPDGEVRCRGLVMATPAPATLALAGDLLTPPQRKVLQSIEYTPAVTAALFSETPLFDQAFNLSMPPNRAFTDLYDATWVQRKNLGRRGDGWVLGVHAPDCGACGNPLLGYSDATLIRRFTADLAPLVGDVEKRVYGFDVQRHPLAFPLLRPGAFAALQPLHESLEDSALQLAGDYLVYPTFEAAADSGALAAERLREAL